MCDGNHPDTGVYKPRVPCSHRLQCNAFRLFRIASPATHTHVQLPLHMPFTWRLKLFLLFPNHFLRSATRHGAWIEGANTRPRCWKRLQMGRSKYSTRFTSTLTSPSVRSLSFPFPFPPLAHSKKNSLVLLAPWC